MQSRQIRSPEQSLVVMEERDGRLVELLALLQDALEPLLALPEESAGHPVSSSSSRRPPLISTAHSLP